MLAGAAAAVMLLPATALAGWGRPIRVAGPFAQDVLPAQAAVASDGAAAIGFGTVDGDNPSHGAAFSVVAGGGFRFGRARRLGGELNVLAVGFEGRQPFVLAGAARGGRPCCGSAQVIGGGLRQTVFGHLAGAAQGALLPAADGGLAALVAADNGLWEASAGRAKPFGPARRLSATAKLPSAIAASGSAVAWTAVPTGEVVTRTIFVALGPSGRPRAVFRAPRGHAIAELGLATGPGAPALAWIESWNDAAGRYHAIVRVAAAGGRPRALSPWGEQAAGLAVASDARGDQLVTWKSCTASGGCIARAVLRAAGGRFGGVRRLGAIDPSQSPAACVTATGRAFAGWVSPSGHVLAASGLGRLGPARTVSRTSYASDLALAAGPGSSALAAWTQGTLAAEVVAAAYRAG